MRDIRRTPAQARGAIPAYQRIGDVSFVPVSSVADRSGIKLENKKSNTRHSVKYGRVFFGGFLMLSLIVGGALALKYELTRLGESAVTEVRAAMTTARAGDFESSQRYLVQEFATGARWLRPFAWIPQSFIRIPGFSHGMTGEALFSAGREGMESALALLSVVPSILGDSGATSGIVPMIDALEHSKVVATSAHEHLDAAIRSFERVQLGVVPATYRSEVSALQDALPLAAAILDGYAEHQELFAELLGVHGPRIYLFLFQNNHELRATGGFIGSYALLDVNQGKIRRFFVDGIFNPDGQLKENIVPPKPIQKISAGWSLHDSNWFPDFPTSAEKAIFFYEKTGGPTVDGIITLTPEVLARILKLVGAVPLPEYGVTIDAENYMPIIQEEVEEKYDREENNPKKILGDLTEALLRRFLSFDHPKETWELGTTLSGLLNEKHILLYSRHPEIEELIRGAGWSGEVLDTSHDYLSVIHTNINGYKTDGVIKEAIEHEAEIQADGRVIDTVSITRQHQGGNTAYEWWNKVNADYARVYVPKGSKLISAEGMTREFPEAPLDYLALGFRRDPDIVREEEGMIVDEVSGTRISEDTDKTVFGNWVYVSPGESTTVRYVYELPFRVALGSMDDGPPATAYSALYQKQSGTDGVVLRARIRYPDSLQPVWQTPENLIPYQHIFEVEKSLSKDFYWGVVFSRNSRNGE
jgi:hypothetical protein